MMPYEKDREVQFREVVALFRRRWKLIAGCALSGAMLAIIVGANLPPRYTAKAQILVTRPDGGPSESLDAAVVDTHVELILSPSHLREVQASLVRRPGSDLATTAEPSLFAAAKRAFARLRNFPVSLLPGGASAEAPAQAGTAEASSPFDFEVLRKNVNVYKEQHSRVIAVTFTAKNPQTAATIANRVAEIYVQKGRDQLRARRAMTQERLAARIPSARAALDRAETAMRDYRIDSGLLDVKSAELMDRQIAELKRQIAMDVSDLEERDAHLAVLRNYQLREDGLARAVEVLRLYQPASAPEFRSGSGTGEFASGTDMAPPQRERMARLVETARAKLSTDRNALGERIQRTRQRLQSLESSRERMRESEARLRELERAAAEAAQLYENLLRRQTELIVEEGLQQEAHVVSAALPPELPSSPSPALFLLPALVACGIGGGLAALVLEHFDRRVRSESDVEEAVGIACIGLVPALHRSPVFSAQRDLIDTPFGAYAEALRSVVTTALSRRRATAASGPAAAQPAASPAAQGGSSGRKKRQRRLADPTVFSVTSSEQGDGKTTLAVSFAVSAATLGRKVLLIDLDFRSPGIAHALGQVCVTEPKDAGKGTSSVKKSVATIAELGIDYLSLSHRREFALSFLSANHLSSLLDGFREKYDCIVIDSPPLIGATEARLLASLADNIIFALKWGSTDVDVARAALRQLRHGEIKDAQGRVLGVITQVDDRKHKFHSYGDMQDASRTVAPPQAGAGAPAPRDGV